MKHELSDKLTGRLLKPLSRETRSKTGHTQQYMVQFIQYVLTVVIFFLIKQCRDNKLIALSICIPSLIRYLPKC